MTPDSVSISIVLHNQAPLAQHLLEDISAVGNELSAEILLTVNTHESLPFHENDYCHPITIIRNARPKGFGANHNFAFRQSQGRFFCVLNPDIRLLGNPFDHLTGYLKRNGDGVVAPQIIDPAGHLENNARRFPTPFSIVKKALVGTAGLDYPFSAGSFEPDWIGGMFMLFSRNCYEAVKGFDERYFLYYEDVDLCARFKRAGFHVFLDRDVRAVHDARYESHRNLQYLGWHLKSMLRFFASKGFREFVMRPRLKG
jgi:GT2 family glycosyltransferase